MEIQFTHDEIGKIVIAIILLFLFIKLFFIGNDSSSDKENKPATLKDLNLLFTQHKEVADIGKYLDFINQEFHEKRELVEALEGEIIEKEIELEKHKERIEHVINSPELKEIENIKDEIIKLEEIKSKLKRLSSKNSQRFSIALLISLVQELYYELYEEEISIEEIEKILNQYLGDESTDSDTDTRASKKTLKQQKRKASFFAGRTQ